MTQREALTIPVETGEAAPQTFEVNGNGHIPLPGVELGLIDEHRDPDVLAGSIGQQATNGFLEASKRAAEARARALDPKQVQAEAEKAKPKPTRGRRGPRRSGGRIMHFDFRLAGAFFETPTLSSEKFNTFENETKVLLGSGMFKRLFPEGKAADQHTYLRGLLNKGRDPKDKKVTVDEYKALVNELVEAKEMDRHRGMLTPTPLAIPHLLPAVEYTQRRKFKNLYDKVVEESAA